MGAPLPVAVVSVVRRCRLEAGARAMLPRRNSSSTIRSRCSAITASLAAMMAATHLCDKKSIRRHSRDATLACAAGVCWSEQQVFAQAVRAV